VELSKLTLIEHKPSVDHTVELFTPPIAFAIHPLVFLAYSVKRILLDKLICPWSKNSYKIKPIIALRRSGVCNSQLL